MTIKQKIAIWSAGLLCSTFISCNETAGPLNNTVMAQFNFYRMSEGETEAIQLLDTLTVTAVGTDSVLINRDVSAQGIQIPLSYARPTDTLSLRYANDNGRVVYDTLIISKESYQQFEAPECPTVTFHQIKAIRSTHRYIDTVQIVNPNIDYNATENFKIVFYTTE